MIGQWLRIGFIVIASLGLLITAIASILIVIGKARGVKEITLPDDSLMAAKATEADFTDTFQIPVPADRFSSLDDLIKVAFQKGNLVDRNDQEIVYKDVAPGLTFYVSYSLKNGRDGSFVTMSTSVHYENATGRIYFRMVRPFHHRLIPFAISQMVQ